MKSLMLSLCLFVFATSISMAQKSPVNTSSGAAIKGYDAVAYFTDGKPLKGSKKFSVNWQGSDWFFSTQENQKTFAANPEKYAPQYGGYCAFGVSEGHKAAIDPEAWTIVEGKLYLNYSKQVKTEWMKNEKERIDQANMNWPKIKDKD